MDQKPSYEALARELHLLKERENKYRHLFETAMVGIYRTRFEDGKFLAANQSLAKMMGYETVAQLVDDYVTSEQYTDPARRDELIRQLENHGHIDGFEAEMKRADGSKIQIALSARSYPDLGYIEGVIIDITDRKNAEIALRKSENQYRTISELTSDFAYAFRIESDGQLINQWTAGALTPVTGYSRNELGVLGGWEHLIHKDDIHITHLQLETLLVNKEITVEYRIITKDGQVRWMRDYARPRWDRLENRVSHIEGAVQDITEWKQAQEALRTSHERFLTVLESIDATIYVADMNTFEILFMNKNMIDTFGRDMTGEICWKAFRNNREQCQHCPNDRLINAAGDPTGVYVWQGENPITGKWYINYDRAIEWTDGRLARLQIATDVTGIREMEEKLRQAQKMEAIGTLAGGITHNFNNLLMGIQGHISLMAFNMNPADPHHEHIRAIDEYIKRAVDLTKQLLGFVRGGKYEVKPIDLETMVFESVDMFGRTRKEIQIKTHSDHSKPVVEADRNQLEQVFLNLYINAWQAMPEGGQLSVTTTVMDLDIAFCQPHKIDPGRYAKISVTDTGIGMDDMTQQKIFDPFFTTKDKTHGTGLGLASAYGIIKNHGGMITVTSQVGQSTTFDIYLPVTEKIVH